jgi:hypothetical protein
MKTPIFVLLLFRLGCQAQDVDSIYKEYLRSWTMDTVDLSGILTFTPKLDTMPAIFLVCDTSKTEYLSYEWGRSVNTVDTITVKNTLNVYWQRGYMVRNPITGEVDAIDADRKRFKENIVIWDYKIIY